MVKLKEKSRLLQNVLIFSICIIAVYISVMIAAMKLLISDVDVSGRSGSGNEACVREKYVLEKVPAISAEGAALYNCSTDEFLYCKNGSRRLYPASTTKIMTALITLEILDELELSAESEVRVPAEAEGTEGSSLYLKEGERLSIEELLYGLMLKSGNDSAETLAHVMCGGRDLFIKKMNERAEKIGCDNTAFTNPSGLFDENHYTTAGDLALIAAEAMRREDFRKIVSAKKWESKDDGRVFHNKNKTVFQYDGGDGIKIGFTKKSGRTLVASAERNGTRLIAVVLNDSDWFSDAYKLLDCGFEACGCD